MEFALGILFAFATVFFVRKFILTDNTIKSASSVKLIYRQSHVFSLVSPYLELFPSILPMPDTQSYRHESKNKLRVVFTDSKAYWIVNNALHQADLVDGLVDESTTKVVDTMSMDKVELDKMIFIVQQLTEGTTNDGRSSGY
jgi:predicted small secreted protein